VCENVGHQYAGHHYDMEVIMHLIQFGIASIGKVRLGGSLVIKSILGSRLVNCRLYIIYLFGPIS
jgi:hypothetical protein